MLNKLKWPHAFEPINKYKFHLRMMMLLVGDLDVYVHKKPRMLIATKEWNYEDRNWDNNFIHITNHSPNNFEMVPIEQVYSNDPWILLSREKYYIRKFDPVLNIRM